jgi:hypothetical protein
MALDVDNQPICRDSSRHGINDIAAIFDDFERFCTPEWDCVAKGHNLVRAGAATADFLNRTGPFKGMQTIGNLPKLQKIVNVARGLKQFLDDRAPSTSILHFITNGHTETQVWQIHRHLLDIGYTADITAVHFMMEIGFPIVKPDIVLTGLFLHWGWLHAAMPDLPGDVTREDLKGKGKYGCRFKYDSPRVYRPVIDLARRIVEATRTEDLRADIGWVTNNPVREFDLFVVKSGQQVEDGWGITRQLFKADWPSKTGRTQCTNR